jgi:hypothetical protein
MFRYAFQSLAPRHMQQLHSAVACLKLLSNNYLYCRTVPFEVSLSITHQRMHKLYYYYYYYYYY